MKKKMNKFKFKGLAKLTISLLLIILSLGSIQGQGKVYFLHSHNKIQRINTDGSEQEDLILSRLNSPTDIEVDSHTNTIFWAETNKIMSMNKNSGKVEILVEYPQVGAFGTALPAIALDSTNRKLFWINASDKKIQRSNFDGTSIEDVITDTNIYSPMSLAVDPANEKIYWSGIEYIKSVNFDGTEIEDIVTTGIYSPRGITLDLDNDKIYWVDLVGNDINRANLDGSNIEELVTDIENPTDVVLNAGKTEIYWLDKGRTGDKGTLQKANLDGSNITEFVSGIDDPIALTINNSNNQVFWLDDYIGSINTDGSEQDTILISLSRFENLKINETEQMLYWVDQSSKNIYKANLDGSQIQLIVETRANDFAFDSENQHIYWTEKDTIRRAKLDGTGIMDLVASDLDDPNYLALDIPGNKMYWVDGGFNSDRIKWANLDGSESTDFMTGLDEPSDLKLGNLNDKIYWLEGGFFPTELRRTNMDGTSSIEDVITEGSGINSYSLLTMNDRLFWSSRYIFSARRDGSGVETIVDNNNTGLSGYSLNNLTIGGEKLYWHDSDEDNPTIWRSNLDGTDVETVVSGLSNVSDREIIVFDDSFTYSESNSKNPNDQLIKIFPNPVNSASTIQFTVLNNSHISLTIYNISGHKIKTLVNERRNVGTYSIPLNVNSLSDGIYFICLKANNYIGTRKIILLN
jgi:uncharacterized protein YjbI with pentapeptide repeats